MKKKIQDTFSNPKDLLGIKKVPIHLVPASSIIYQAMAMKDGHKKYTKYNWRSNKVIASIYFDACLRHLFAWMDGEEDAPDSKMPHLAHALACLGILIDALVTGNLIDDRPTRGKAAELLERFKETNEEKNPTKRSVRQYNKSNSQKQSKGSRRRKKEKQDNIVLQA